MTTSCAPPAGATPTPTTGAGSGSGVSARSDPVILVSGLLGFWKGGSAAMGAKPPLFCTGEAGQNFSQKAFFAGQAGVPVWANRTATCGTRPLPLPICCGAGRGAAVSTSCAPPTGSSTTLAAGTSTSGSGVSARSDPGLLAFWKGGASAGSGGARKFLGCPFPLPGPEVRLQSFVAMAQPQKPPALQFVRIVQIRQNKKEGALCLPDRDEIQEEIQKGCVDGEEAVVAWTAEFAADQRRPSPFSLFVVPRQEHSHCSQDKR